MKQIKEMVDIREMCTVTKLLRGEYIEDYYHHSRRLGDIDFQTILCQEYINLGIKYDILTFHREI